MAEKKSNPNGRELPALGDVLLAQADLPDRGKPPAELNAARNFLVIDQRAALGSVKTSALSLQAIHGHQYAQALSSESAVLGHLGQSLEQVAVPRKSFVVARNAEPYLPQWSGVSFAPRASVAASKPVLRRRSGAKVRPETVFPPDGRQVYCPNSYPWRIVGRIFVWTNASAPNPAWTGSASLVGKNVILTASHVVPWGSGSNWKALFVPAYCDGMSLYGANAASWISSARGYKDHDQGDDMAIMKLVQPLGDWLGYFGYKTYNDDWEGGNYWTIAGYPGDVASGERPSANYWFPITDDDNDGAGVELEYKADTNDGNSGGPVFGWWGGKPYVIGTHSGGEDNFGEPKQNVAAGGSALSSLIAWGRNNW